MSREVPKAKYPRGKLILAVVKDALYDWVKKELQGQVDGTSIIWRDQSQPLPSRPCVAMKIVSGPHRVGFQDNLGIDENGKTGAGGQRTLVVSMQVFGNTQMQGTQPAAQVAIDLNASLSKPSVLAQLRSKGVAIQNQGEVTNLTDVEETQYEERAEFSVMLGVAENVVDDPGYFDDVGPIGSTVNN